MKAEAVRPALAAGLDTFDAQHALAPAVPQLRFAVRKRGGAMLDGDLPTAKLAADAFTLALPVGTDAPFWAVALANTVFLTGDWCSFFKDQDRTWSVNVESPLASAMLREGECTLPLKVKGRQFELPLDDAGWGNDAVVDLAFVAPEGATP
jgi:hypothetical protein